MSQVKLSAPLKIKTYRHLFIGQFFSDFGGYLDMIALQILIIYIWNLGPAYTAALLVIYSIPIVGLGPLAGVLVDRLPKKAVMLAGDLVRAVLAAFLIFAPNVYVLYIIVFLMKAFGSFFDPARQSMIRHTVPENLLLQASSLSQLLMNVVKILAPAAGSTLMLITHPSALFIIEALGFAFSAFFIAGIPAVQEKRPPIRNNQSSFKEEFKEGLSFIRTNALIGFSIGFLTAGMFLIFLYEALFTPWARSMEFAQSQLGFIAAANGIGMAAGSLLLGKWTFWKKRPLHLMLISGMVSGLFVTLFGLGSFGILDLPKPAWITVFLLLGISGGSAFLPFGYILQKETPASLMGRVSGAASSFMNLSMLIGPVAGGMLAFWLGAGGVFIGAGVLLSMIGLAGLFIIKRKFVYKGKMKKPA